MICVVYISKNSRNFKLLVKLWIAVARHTFNLNLKGLAHAKIIKKSLILFRVLNMTI